jgi:hypothetical protein
MVELDVRERRGELVLAHTIFHAARSSESESLRCYDETAGLIDQQRCVPPRSWPLLS